MQMVYRNLWYRPRNYLHFDLPITDEDCVEKIVTNPNFVKSHSFYPLIAYKVISEKIKKDPANNSIVKKIKERPISYAAHLDSHIYSYYAFKLSSSYEAQLLTKDIGDCVLAFRELGKSNIDFALDAFNEIRKMENCTAIALDISGFFDNIDHKILKKSWSNIVGEPFLPKDHYAVFKSLTKYSSVSKTELYSALNISKNNPKNGRRRVCEPIDFRNQVRLAGLIKTNDKPYGIPQGSPISALLSNIYMLNFDVFAKKLALDCGGKYFRYCDDMLFIVPNQYKDVVHDNVCENIKSLEIQINNDKTEIRDFYMKSGMQLSSKPLQYLGFTYDGRNILIRSAALARFSDKMKRGVRLAKLTMYKRNDARAERGVSPKSLYRRKIYMRYSHLGRCNFIRYGVRASEIMQSPAIKRQLKPLWGRLIKEIEK